MVWGLFKAYCCPNINDKLYSNYKYPIKWKFTYVYNTHYAL